MIENFLVGHGQKWVWAIWPLGHKTDYLKNEEMDLTDFLRAGTNSLKLIGD